MYNHSSQLPVAISKQTFRKRSKHCQYSLDKKKNTSGSKYEWKNAETWWIFFMKYSPIAEEGGCVVCSDRLGPDFISQYAELLCFCVIFTPIFPVWAIYSMGAERVSRTQRMDFGCGWLFAALFGPVQKNSGVGVLENALPLSNNTTTLNFLMPSSYTHVHFFLCVIPANRNWLEEMAFYDSNNTGMSSFSK